MRCHDRSREERGATAIMMALLSTVIFMVGAIAVDMGQVYAKRSALQSNVDMAVMAAAAELTQEAGCNPEVVTKAEEFLLEATNQVHGQVALALQDGDPGNGEISCPGNWRVDLRAPEATVTLGMAKIFEGEESIDVPAGASAQIKSPLRSAGMPMFGVDGCDYGPQVIRDDSGASTAGSVPTLTPNSLTYNSARFTISPNEVPSGTPSQTLTLTGTNLSGATAVGFTGAGGPPAHHEVTTFVSATGTEIRVNVPSAVLAVDDVWYVRVRTGTGPTARWSREQNPHGAQRFTVGDGTGYCVGSVAGNYGTIDLPRTDTSFDLEWNMILGPQRSLAIHPAPAGECGGTGSPTVESKTVPVDGTNCVSSATGLKMAQANAGLIHGAGGRLGRLDKPTTGDCSRNGTDSQAAIDGEDLNDDLLTCFITNGASIGDLVAGNTAGTNALSGDIFRSPRYFWIPIVEKEPSTGKKSWPIIAFRPGFITDQALTATNASPGTVVHTGLVTGPSGLRELHVILFHDNALPETAPALGGEGDYTGSGTKVVVLVE